MRLKRAVFLAFGGRGGGQIDFEDNLAPRLCDNFKGMMIESEKNIIICDFFSEIHFFEMIYAFLREKNVFATTPKIPKIVLCLVNYNICWRAISRKLES